MLLSLAFVGRAQDENQARPSTPPPPPSVTGAVANPPSPIRATTHPPHDPVPVAERRAKEMQTRLGLSPEQYKGIYDAELEFTKVIFQQRSAQPGGPRPDRDKIMKANEVKDAKYKTILTPEQWEKYDAMRPKTPPPPPLAPGTPPPAAK